MAEYGNGFMLDFVYCTNCYFFRDKRNPMIDNDEPVILKLKEQLYDVAERIHDSIMDDCKGRALIISYNRVMIENGTNSGT